MSAELSVSFTVSGGLVLRHNVSQRCFRWIRKSCVEFHFTRLCDNQVFCFGPVSSYSNSSNHFFWILFVIFMLHHSSMIYMHDRNTLIPYLFPFFFSKKKSSFFLQWNLWGLYRHKPRAAELWKRSQKVDGFDFFISHTWRTPGRWKILSLLMRLRICSFRFFDSKSGLSLLPPLHLFC